MQKVLKKKENNWKMKLTSQLLDESLLTLLFRTVWNPEFMRKKIYGKNKEKKKDEENIF